MIERLFSSIRNIKILSMFVEIPVSNTQQYKIELGHR